MSDTYGAEGTQLLYPRPGLPALAYAGEPLVLRVRVATPLTPPPGVQQEKALRGWSVQLEGRPRITLGRSEVRFRLRVSDVRPDGQTPLLYRARVELPPSMPPGSYDVALRAPRSRTDRVLAGLRVVAAGSEPRLARIPREAALRDLETAAVDVWIADALPRPMRGEPAVPWLSASTQAALLRVGGKVLVLGGCDDPHLRFADHLAALGDLERATLPSEFGAPARVLVEGRAITNEGPGPAAWLLAVPEDNHATTLEGADPRWFPAVPMPPSAHRPSLAAWVTQEPGRVRWSRAPRRASLQMVAPPEVRAGRPAPFRLEGQGLRPPLHIAFSWAEDGRSWVPLTQTHLLTLPWRDRQQIHALAVDREGRAVRAQTSVDVQADFAHGCSAARGSPGDFLAWWLALCTIGVARYMSRRRIGNATGPPRRDR